VHETLADLAALQHLLDRSYATAGLRLRSIITPERRLSAGQVADRLTGMRLLALATVTADGRPIVEIYIPRYGPQWEEFLDSGPVYARINADRMFTFHTTPDSD
jgi:hypothetical protein